MAGAVTRRRGTRSEPTGARLARIGVQAGFLVALVALWHGVTVSGLVSPLFLPKPLDVGAAFIGLIASGDYLRDLSVTLYQFALAAPVAIVLGTLAGYFISTSRYSTQVFEPVVAALYAVPIIVFYPISVLVFGVGPESKIAHGALFGFFPVCLNTAQGFARVDPAYLRLAHSMGASRTLVLKRILVPAALPTILGGWRMGMTLSFLAIIGAETIASLEGLGHRIVWYAEGMRTTPMFAFILLVILIVVVVNTLLSLLERLGRRVA
jgi:ABC-type nitrate/sulfonate/bicarbonate transport system permease component